MDPHDLYYAGVRQELKPYIPHPHNRVLEIGCGRGGFRSHLSGGAEVWGVEPSPDAAAIASTALHRVLVGTYEQVHQQLPDHYFDLVICNDVIEHMPDDRWFLLHVQNKMSAGARLMGSIPNIRHWPVLKALVLDQEWEYKDEGVLDRTHLRFYTIKSFPRLLEQTGYKILCFEGINPTIHGRAKRFLRMVGPRRMADVQYMQFAFVTQMTTTNSLLK